MDPPTQGDLADVQIYDRVLTASEIAAHVNQPPPVNAGPDAWASVGVPITLSGSVTDDGIPAPSTITTLWTLVSGPPGGHAVFTSPTSTTTDVTFDVQGTYVIRLQASDGQLLSGDELTVTAGGIIISPLSGLETTEEGGTAQFTIVLGTAPTASVTIPLSSSDPTEGIVSPSSVTFTTGNWNVPQIVTVTGVDDPDLDFNVLYWIITGPASSADPIYDNLNPPDVQIVNVDDEKVPELDRVWGGCGLLGPEALLPLLIWGIVRCRRPRR